MCCHAEQLKPVLTGFYRLCKLMKQWEPVTAQTQKQDNRN
jgi:hypothetical protein